MPRSDSGGSGVATGTTKSGAGLSFEQFMIGISEQESGGNYNAVNSSTGALGKYQIMPDNVPAWSKEYLGQTYTPNQFLHSPALQERLARAVLYDYFQKHGARGAAAEWYSGQAKLANDYAPQNGGPSIGSYVDSVIGHAMSVGQADAIRMAGQVSTSGSVTSTSTDKTTPGTPIGELNPAKPDQNMDRADALGMAGYTAPGADSAYAPGAASADGMTPGVIGADRQQILDQLNQDPSQTPTTPITQTQKAPVAFTDPHQAGRDQFLKYAMSALGTPYQWGGTGPGGFDCSGLIYWAMRQAGYNGIPRLAATQMGVGPSTTWANIKPGDFVGWDENPNDANGNGADHIAIYLGNNQILEAPHTGADVRVRDLGASDKASGWAIDTSNLFK